MQSGEGTSLRIVHHPRGRRLIVLMPLWLAGCDGPQSWLAPAGRGADTVAGLFWVVVPAAAVIWTVVIGLAVYAGAITPRPHSEKGASRLILWGGIVAPTATIFALMVVSLFLLRDVTGNSADLTLNARGEQWWWRLAYEDPQGRLVPVPNELRLPVGHEAEILLTANRVIHSFWAPTLGGKIDMIPGRENRMTLTPTTPGVYRGQCAEFCGEAHAQMAFPVVVMQPDAFDDWLAGQAQPARAPATEAARRGAELFLSEGCGACHTVRGTPASGEVGPDLTHVGSRLTIGAGVLETSREALIDWIAAPEVVKPGARMPGYAMLSEAELGYLADYLMGLE
ncbi:cytochrome c oxidase subunit II [Tranquillimonas alkanivorans]|uniref:Cytochrome c oxidase subunit 2 n=1 Tax=Tranquillimonas alkanivorans TaxID=441119 RepID=A0A1I5QAJ6_9RHOB|nr:c-type cytochrome [Tranquillimonas alkanivorans]SFP43282.1 cytochrome c oxidase subunit 2 [Tranquillimonas alkanivorans]